MFLPPWEILKSGGVSFSALNTSPPLRSGDSFRRRRWCGAPRGPAWPQDSSKGGCSGNRV